MAGLGLGLGLTVLFEMQDTSMRSERDIENVLHMPVLGMIPVISVDGEKKKLPRAAQTIGPTRMRA